MNFRVVLRNVFAMLTSNVVTNLIGFVASILMMRYLGPERLGRYTYLMAYPSLFAMLPHLGLYLVLSRDVASHPEQAEKSLGSILSLQYILAPVALIVITATAWGFNSPTEVLWIAVSSAGFILNAWSNSYGAVLMGLERMHLNALINIGMSVLWAFMVLAVISLGLGVSALVVAFVLHKLLNLWAYRFCCRIEGGTVPAYGFSRNEALAMIRQALPFALILLSNDIYWNLGYILVNKLSGPQQLGAFTAAFKLLIPLVTSIGTVSGVLYPRFANLYATDPNTFNLYLGRMKKYALLIGLPSGLWISFCAAPVIHLLYAGKFPSASSTLLILGWFVPPFCLYTILSSALQAVGGERIWAILTALSAAIVVGGTWFLTPFFGDNAAAWAYLASGIFLVVAILVSIKMKNIQLPWTSEDMKLGFAFCAMASALWLVRSVPILAVPISGLVFAAALRLQNFFTPDELSFFSNSITRTAE